MIELAVEQIHVDGSHPTSWHEALLRVVATLSIRRGEVALWSEDEVPILELAYQLHRWLAISASRGGRFVYQSMESDVPEWLWFKQMNGGWSIGSGATRLADGLSLDDLKAAAKGFLDHVMNDVPATVGVDAQDVIQRPS